MNRTITTLMAAGALALGVACNEQTESAWEQTGQSAGEAVRETGSDLERGAEHAWEEGREGARDLGGDVERAGRDVRRDERTDVADERVELEREQRESPM